MPSAANDKTKALAELKLYVDWNVDPKLTDSTGGDLDTILDSCKRADYWTASTAYEIGDVVQPLANKTGRRYICIQSGSSDATEPEAWPTVSRYPSNDGLRVPVGRTNIPGGTVVDGDVIWQEAGPAYSNVFDTRFAIHQAWLVKAGRASGYYNFSDGGQKFDVEAVYKHCTEKAAEWMPLDFA